MNNFLIYSYVDTNSHEGCSFQEIAKLTQPSLIEYAKIHEYDYYFQDSGFNTNLKIGWERYTITLEKFSDYKWIFYVDADATIMNHTIRLENIVDDNYDIMVARNSISKDWNGINTGVIFFKNSQWTKDFLNFLLTKTHLHNIWGFEQSALIEAYTNNEMDCQKHIKVTKNRLFNSYAHQWYVEDNFRVGDFVCHAAGSSNQFREKLFTELNQKIIKLPKNEINTEFFV